MHRFISRLAASHNKIFLILLGADALILVFHFLFGGHSQFFHLDFEQNLPTLYQSTKLIVFGGMFLVAGLTNKKASKARSFVLPLAAFVLLLGLDELLQIHENIYRIFEFFEWLHPSKIVDASMKMGYRSSLWILYYLPALFVFVFWGGYWLRSFQSRFRDNFRIIALSSLSFFTILLTEILSSTGTYSNRAYFWLITTEETAEMLLATTLILVGLKVLNRSLRFSKKSYF